MPIFATLKIYYMGRGDRRTRKGKIFAGSFGNARPAREKKSEVTEQATAVVSAETKKKSEKKA